MQGATKIAEGVRKVASKAKKVAGRILDVVEDVGSMTAVARRVLRDLIDELHGSLPDFNVTSTSTSSSDNSSSSANSGSATGLTAGTGTAAGL